MLPLLAAFSGCAPLGQPTESAAPSEVPVQSEPPDAKGAVVSTIAEPATAASEHMAPPTASALVAASFTDLPKWRDDDQAAALKAFVQGCNALEIREAWRRVCEAARKVTSNRSDVARRFFETHFQAFRVADGGGVNEGLITGYYEPLLFGSRSRSERYRYPIYAVPADLLSVDLAQFQPELKGLRLRGRLQGRRVVPYYTRAEIESGRGVGSAAVLYWVDDPIDLFFLQIQGSGQIRLETGERVRVGYADQNGYPYRSIGRLLIERGELSKDDASMQDIKAWARQNPDKLADVLNHNARYVFFRELAAGSNAPLGALGVPLSAGRSLAVDPSHIPLGAPVFLDTTWPNSTQKLRRLMMAQDTGSAIRGAVRADYFWGFGEQAGAQAGRMKQRARLWVLTPNGVTPEALLAR